jgi:hypothetical protein
MFITTTNTSLQVIDTFDVPNVKTINYEVHALDRNNSSVSYVTVNHNGIETSEVQTAVSVSGYMPAEITTDIANNVGRVLIQPQVAPTDYTITKSVVACNLYSENTLSGRLIRSSEGFGITSNTVTVRQSNNNFYGYSNAFITSNTLGPLVTRDELYDFDNLTSYNESDIELSGNVVIITSSGRPRNNHYLELSVSPGTVYRVSCNAYYDFNTVYANEDTFDIGVRLAIGTSVSNEDIVYRNVSQTDTQYVLDLIPEVDTVYVGFGFGALGSKLYLENISVKELVPFHTYDQHEGTFYTKWNAITAGSVVFQAGNNSVYVNAANNVYINTVNCGAQQINNRVAFSYSNNTIAFSFNGSTVASQSATFYGNTQQLVFVSSVEEFSYVPELISNTSLLGLTNG